MRRRVTRGHRSHDPGGEQRRKRDAETPYYYQDIPCNPLLPTQHTETPQTDHRALKHRCYMQSHQTQRREHGLDMDTRRAGSYNGTVSPGVSSIRFFHFNSRLRATELGSLLHANNTMLPANDTMHLPVGLLALNRTVIHLPARTAHHLP